MLERGLRPDFSAAVLAELDKIPTAVGLNDKSVRDASEIRDLTGLLWASIDNDDSRDLDQLTIPVDGRVTHGFEGVDVGDRIHVQLISTNVELGFIDFKRVGSASN
jgi:hypothetical protein